MILWKTVAVKSLNDKSVNTGPDISIRFCIFLYSELKMKLERTIRHFNKRFKLNTNEN